MTERQIKKLHKLLGMQNQTTLKKDIEICKKFYINDDWEYREHAMILIDYYKDILHLVKENTYVPTEVIKKIELGL